MNKLFLLNGIKALFAGIFRFKKLIPLGFALSLILVDIFVAIIEAASNHNYFRIWEIIGVRILAIDYRIYELTQVYILTPEMFSWYDFFIILSSVYLFYKIIKLIYKGLFWLIGESTSSFVISILSLLIIFLIEVAITKSMLDVWFIPLKGIWFFIVQFPNMFTYLWNTHNINTVWNSFLSRVIDDQYQDLLINQPVLENVTLGNNS